MTKLEQVYVKKKAIRIIWRSPTGEVIACVEKNKVLQENLEEIRQTCQDALEDAVLMGCDEQQVRAVLTELIATLHNPYSPQ
jgi:DNA-binding transcriptional regulator YhcF (GntR family)